MAPALSTELFELEAIRRFLFVLRRNVVPVLTLGALKRDVIPWHNSSSLVIRHWSFAVGPLSLPKPMTND
jgi:hypothetical protein